MQPERKRNRVRKSIKPMAHSKVFQKQPCSHYHPTISLQAARYCYATKSKRHRLSVHTGIGVSPATCGALNQNPPNRQPDSQFPPPPCKPCKAGRIGQKGSVCQQAISLAGKQFCTS